MVPIKTIKTPDDDQPSETKVLAKQFLRHNMFNQETFEAQAEVLGYNNMNPENNNLYFTGGWTHGAGLHEDCCIQARDNMERICTGKEVTADFHIAGNIAGKDFFNVVPDHVIKTTQRPGDKQDQDQKRQRTS